MSSPAELPNYPPPHTTTRGQARHGWRFPAWKDKLAPYWKEKIERNRTRDQSNFNKLRRNGWVVIRLWEREIQRDPERCVDSIELAVRQRQQPDGRSTTSAGYNSMQLMALTAAADAEAVRRPRSRWRA